MKALIRLIILSLLGCITFSYAMFQGEFVSWFLFYTYVPIVIYSTYLYFFTFKNWKITRDLAKKQYYDGDSATVCVTIERKLFLPLLFVIVEDELPPRLQSDGANKQLFFLGMKRKFHFQYGIAEMKRGVHQFLSVKLTITDFLGVFKKTVTLRSPSTLIVFPKYFQLSVLMNEVSNSGNALSGKTFNTADSLFISGIREFKIGDRRSLIDWKATAKKQTLMTKEFDSEKSDDVVILMDCSNKQTDKSFEQVVSTAASLVYFFTTSQKSCQFISVGAMRVHETVADADSFHRLLYTLARITNDGTLPFSQVIAEEYKKIRNEKQLCIVTSEVTTIEPFEHIPSSRLLIFIENDQLDKSYELEALKEKGITIVENISRKGL